MIPERPKFANAWISGASSGLGRAIAIELARRGSFVHLFARGVDGLEETLRQVEAAGSSGLIHTGDVTDHGRLEESLRLSDEHSMDGLDLVIAGAGVSEAGLPPEMPQHEVSARIFDVNLTAAARAVDIGINLMKRRGRGTVSAITSLAGLRAIGAAPAYSASKVALVAYLRARQSSALDSGLRLVDIRPGFVRTPMTDRNEFHMPFLLEPEDAARRSVRGLERGSPAVSYPRRLAWPMALCAKAVPEFVWRRVTRK